MVIRLGIIGLSADPQAWAAIAHIGPLREKALVDKYELTAVATSSMKTAKAAAQAYGVPESKAYDNPDDIANDKDVDMVVVSVKVSQLNRLQCITNFTMPALRAKKDVLVEWPLGANTAQAKELAALAKKQNVKNVVALQARTSPLIQKAKEIIDSGALGRIIATNLVVNSSTMMKLPEKATYLKDQASGASVVSIAVAHSIDPLVYLLGEFEWLSALLTTNNPTVQFYKSDGSLTSPEPRNFVDGISIHGKLIGGTTVVFVYNTTEGTPEGLTWDIIGEKGTIKMDLERSALQMAEGKMSLYQPQSAAEDEGIYRVQKAGSWTDVPIEPHMALGGIGEVYSAFAEGKGCFADFDEAVKRHKMVDAIFRSGEKGTRESYL